MDALAEEKILHRSGTVKALAHAHRRVHFQQRASEPSGPVQKYVPGTPEYDALMAARAEKSPT